jgi:Undecaprenyl-phosphate glucose phosphotransferase
MGADIEVLLPMFSDSASRSVGPRIDPGAIPASGPADANGRPVSLTIVLGLLGAIDGLTIFASGILTLLWPPLSHAVDWQAVALIVPFGSAIGVNFLYLCGCYRRAVVRDGGAAMSQTVTAWLISMTTVIAVVYLANEPAGGMRGWLILWAIVGLAALLSVRLMLRFQLRAWQRAGRLCENVAIVGAGPLGQRLLRHLATNPDPLIRIVGLYDDRLARLPPRCMGHAVRGTVDDLVKDARERRIDIVMVALPLAADWRLAEIMNKLRLLPVDVRLPTDNFGLRLKDCRVSHVAGLAFLHALDRPLRDWRLIAKDAEDRILSALILLLIAPVLAIVALLIKLDSPGPVLFRQKRFGFNNQLIEVFKFRTMYHHACDQNAEQLTRRNDPRVTTVGAILRRTSLDELPQFINVLRGEMSIVGPRPHATAAKAGGLLYQEAVKAYDARHRVKPGITGWAQINGWRGETETTSQITKRVEYDLYYIENWSLLLDLTIIARTIPGMLTSRYAY